MKQETFSRFGGFWIDHITDNGGQRMGLPRA
jgi:hypothetical protein